MQLDTLLSSLLAHWKSPDIRVDVVYNFSTKDFGEAYERLSSDYSDKNIKLHRECISNPDRVKIQDFVYLYNLVRLYKDKKLRHPKTNFRSIVIDLIEKSEAENVMFLTDDSMFVSDVNILQEDISWINDKPWERQFSLRLGEGVNPLPKDVEIEGLYCNWNMYQNIGNWGYPFSVDAHIYNKNVILKLLKTYLFYNPSFLEGNICGVVRRAKYFAESRCYRDIKMLTFPINIVQSSVDNDSQDVSVEMLNALYLKGERLEYVVDERFDATKQYVKMLKFKNQQGECRMQEISQELIRPNNI